MVNVTLMPGTKLLPCNCKVSPMETLVLPLKVERWGASTVRPSVKILVRMRIMAKRKMSHAGAQPAGWY